MVLDFPSCRDERLSWHRWPVTCWDGLSARRWSPIQVLTQQCMAESWTRNMLITSPTPYHYTTKPTIYYLTQSQHWGWVSWQYIWLSIRPLIYSTFVLIFQLLCFTHEDIIWRQSFLCWPGQSHGTVYQQQFVMQTICVLLSEEWNHIF